MAGRAIWSPEVAATLARAKLCGGARCHVQPRREGEEEGRWKVRKLTLSMMEGLVEVGEIRDGRSRARYCRRAVEGHGRVRLHCGFPARTTWRGWRGDHGATVELLAGARHGLESDNRRWPLEARVLFSGRKEEKMGLGFQAAAEEVFISS